MPRRIAIVSTILAYPWGGADGLWTSAAEAAARRGDALLLAVSDLVVPAPRVQRLLRNGARLHLRPSAARSLGIRERLEHKLRRLLRRPNPLVRAVRAFGPDLVVFSCGGTYDPILEPALCEWLRQSGTAYRIVANLQVEHPALPEHDRRIIRRILAGAERIFFVSERNREITRRHLLDPLPNAECIHGCAVHNPIIPSQVPPWPSAGTPWSMATVGRLEPVKGVDLLLHALAQGLGSEPGWRLNIHGKGPERDILVEAAARLGLESRVRLPGFVADLDDLWKDNHLLVSPAIEEGLPITIPEAMLRSRPVLATQVGGAEEWIVPGQTGFLCPAPTVELLADGLRRAWAQRENWRAMGAAAQARSRDLYRPNDYERIVA